MTHMCGMTTAMHMWHDKRAAWARGGEALASRSIRARPYIQMWHQEGSKLNCSSSLGPERKNRMMPRTRNRHEGPLFLLYSCFPPFFLCMSRPHAVLRFVKKYVTLSVQRSLEIIIDLPLGFPINNIISLQRSPVCICVCSHIWMRRGAHLTRNKACCTCECVILHMRGCTVANISGVWLFLYVPMNYSYQHDAFVYFLCICTCVR